MPLPGAINRHLTGEFASGLCGSACSDCYSCLYFCYCGPCAVYTQRQRILEITGEPYIMCGGLWPCCGFQHPAPKACLAVEVVCCIGHAVAANRFLVQTRFNKKNTGCEDCLRIFNICVSCDFFLLRLCGLCSKEEEMLVKASICIPVCAHCQNDDVISQMAKNRSYIAPKQEVIGELPKHFERAGIRVEAAPVQQPLLQ